MCEPQIHCRCHTHHTSTICHIQTTFIWSVSLQPYQRMTETSSNVKLQHICGLQKRSVVTFILLMRLYRETSAHSSKILEEEPLCISFKFQQSMVHPNTLNKLFGWFVSLLESRFKMSNRKIHLYSHIKKQPCAHLLVCSPKKKVSPIRLAPKLGLKFSCRVVMK